MLAAVGGSACSGSSSLLTWSGALVSGSGSSLMSSTSCTADGGGTAGLIRTGEGLGTPAPKNPTRSRCRAAEVVRIDQIRVESSEAPMNGTLAFLRERGQTALNGLARGGSATASGRAALRLIRWERSRLSPKQELSGRRGCRCGEGRSQGRRVCGDGSGACCTRCFSAAPDVWSQLLPNYVTQQTNEIFYVNLI